MQCDAIQGLVGRLSPDYDPDSTRAQTATLGVFIPGKFSKEVDKMRYLSWYVEAKNIKTPILDKPPRSMYTSRPTGTVQHLPAQAA